MINSEYDPNKKFHIFSGQSFVFNPEKLEFIIDSETKQLSDVKDIFDLYNIEEISPSFNWGERTPDLELKGSEVMMVSILLDLMEFPSLRRWIAALENEKTERIVENSMRKVYRKVSPYSVELPRRSSNLGHINFSTRLYSNGAFRLQTFGDCACLGPDPHGMSISYNGNYDGMDDLSLPLQYCLHNADTATQRLSLFAGAGTLAWLCEQEQS